MSSQVLSELTPEMNEQLRMEIGWSEVAGGLGQILLGYLTFFLANAIGIGLILIALYGIPDGTSKLQRMRAVDNASLWECYIGMAIAALGTLFAFILIAGGQFRCMMGSAERKGARWLMFFCVTCLFIAPALNIAAGAAFTQRGLNFDRGARMFTEMKFTQTGQHLQLVGFGIGLLYPLTFLLFLRSCASCMHAKALTAVLSLFLVFALTVTGYTGYLIYNPIPTQASEMLARLLGYGWLGLLLGYLGLIFATRLCLLNTIRRVRSPLELIG
jgi:hypothetical protein